MNKISNYINMIKSQYNDEVISISAENGEMRVSFYENNWNKAWKIDKIILSLEYPENTLDIIHIENVALYNENDEMIYDDQEMVDNQDFHSENEVVEFVKKHYGVSKDIIELI